MTKDIQEMSVAELKQLKASFAQKDPSEITPEQRQGLIELDNLIIDKAVEEKLAAQSKTNDFVEKAKSFDQRAIKMWPELNNPDSDFAKAVEKYMEETGEKDTNPAAMFNAANAIGLEQGLAPAGAQPRTPSATIKGGDGDEEGDGEGEDAYFKNERIKKIAHAFRDVIDVNDPDTRSRLLAFRDEDSAEGEE